MGVPQASLETHENPFNNNHYEPWLCVRLVHLAFPLLGSAKGCFCAATSEACGAGSLAHCQSNLGGDICHGSVGWRGSAEWSIVYVSLVVDGQGLTIRFLLDKLR